MDQQRSIFKHAAGVKSVSAPSARLFQGFLCVLVQLMKSLGVNESWRFVDVVGLESEQLSAVPKPCCSLMLLFPLTQQVMMGGGLKGLGGGGTRYSEGLVEAVWGRMEDGNQLECVGRI